MTLDRNAFRCDRLELFWWFVHERQAIWFRRFVERQPPPWTADHVLKGYRFTNVYRELDPGTRYAIDAILEREAPKSDRLFNVMLYRLIGRPETHAALGFQTLAGFDANHLETTLQRIRAAGQPPFTGAYTVNPLIGMGSRDKIVNVARLFARLQADFSVLWSSVAAAPDAAAAHAALRDPYGFGDFLAYQVLVDLVYPLCREGGRGLLSFSQDDWARAGPGARRGIAALVAEGVRVSPLAVMRWLRDHQANEFERLGLDFPALADAAGNPIAISLANIQNCLCEYHKYVKVREGTGRARRRFEPRLERERSGSVPMDTFVRVGVRAR